MPVFPVAETNSGILLRQPLKTSGFAAAGVEFVTVGRDVQKTFATSVGRITFDEHTFGDAEDKQASDTSVVKVPVTMRSFYHAEWFDKDQYTPQSAAAALIASFPAAVPGAMDEIIAAHFTGTAAPVGDTAASWLAPQDALAAAGYDARSQVLANQAKTLVRGALNEDTNRSLVAVPVVDGITVGSATTYFRNLYPGVPLANGSKLGVVLDPSFTKVFVGGPTKVIVITEDDSVTASNKNGLYAKVEFKVGIATVQASAIPLVAAGITA